MGQTVLKLLRAARQPVMSDLGRALSRDADRPGLALIAVDDFGRASGTVEQHEWGARRSGAQMAHLEGVGHWWPEETPGPEATEGPRRRPSAGRGAYEKGPGTMPGPL